MRYGRFENELKVCVRDSYSEFHGAMPKTVVEFTPLTGEYQVKLYDIHRKQIRGLVRFSDNSWGEAYNEGNMISSKLFPVTYEVSDPSVIAVSERGIIFPLSVGSAEVKVTIAGEKSFTVRVTVTN